MKQDTVELWLLAAATLLPAVGVLLLGWGRLEVAVVYTTEATAVVLSYSVCALFARQPSGVDEADQSMAVVFPRLGWSSLPERVDVPGLPPISSENLRIVVPTAGLMTVVVVILGPVVAGDLLTGPVSARGRGRVVLSSFLTRAWTDVGVVAAAVGVTTGVAQAVTTYRRYAAVGRHQQLSAYDTLQPPLRFLLACLGLAGVWVVGGGLTLAVLSGSVDLPGGVFGALVAGFCLVKLGVEVERTRGESGDAAGRVGSWLVPYGRN